jgi:hypothetical protein
MIEIITNAGKTAEKWDEAKQNLLITSYDPKERKSRKRDNFRVVLATGPVFDPAGFIGLRGRGLTSSKIDDFLSAP